MPYTYFDPTADMVMLETAGRRFGDHFDISIVRNFRHIIINLAKIPYSQLPANINLTRTATDEPITVYLLIPIPQPRGLPYQGGFRPKYASCLNIHPASTDLDQDAPAFFPRDYANVSAWMDLLRTANNVLPAYEGHTHPVEETNEIKEFLQGPDPELMHNSSHFLISKYGFSLGEMWAALASVKRYPRPLPRNDGTPEAKRIRRNTAFEEYVSSAGFQISSSDPEERATSPGSDGSAGPAYTEQQPTQNLSDEESTLLLITRVLRHLLFYTQAPNSSSCVVDFRPERRRMVSNFDELEKQFVAIDDGGLSLKENIGTSTKPIVTIALLEAKRRLEVENGKPKISDECLAQMTCEAILARGLSPGEQVKNERLLKNKRLHVGPLCWTPEHLNFLGCQFEKFESSDLDLSLEPLHPLTFSEKLEKEDLLLLTRRIIGGSGHSSRTSSFSVIMRYHGIICNPDLPQPKFRYGKLYFDIPKCNVFELIDKYNSYAKSIIVHFEYDELVTMREKAVRSPRHSVLDSAEGRLQKLTSPPWFEDPYLMCVMVTIAQSKWKVRKGMGEAHFVQLVVTNTSDKEYAHIFQADIPTKLLDALKKSTKNMGKLVLPAIRHIRVPFKPHESFSKRVAAQLLSGPKTREQGKMPRGKKRKSNEMETEDEARSPKAPDGAVQVAVVPLATG
uniref:Uncharacterized protein n=1 Tax=Gibberella zeae TaxID=5518 RepID=A0A4E9ELC2_GIBZA